MGLQKEVYDQMERVGRGQASASRLCYNPDTRRLEVTGSGNDPDRVKRLTLQDTGLYCTPVIVLDGKLIEEAGPGANGIQAEFTVQDNRTVFSTLAGASGQRTLGTIASSNSSVRADVSEIGSAQDRVRVLVNREHLSNSNSASDLSQSVAGYVRKEGQWVKGRVIVSPVIKDLFTRFKGILETDAISDKRVFIAGLGSGGSAVSVGLAKSGVMDYVLVDCDRLEVGNVLRHEAGISDVGRLKTNVVKHLILNKNPFAKVETVDERITWSNIERFRACVKTCDLVIAAVDNRKAKRVLNRLCLQENVPMIVAGAFVRAYGGQVLLVRPGEGPCFTCFLDCMPEVARNNEISSIEQAEGIAYADRPVPIEPGLGNDISPINQMVVKRTIQELLKGKTTTLQSLDDDLKMPLHLWLNRREKDTCYEDLEPMRDGVGEMAIMRWYGVDLPKNAACPDCGDFDIGIAERYSN